MIGKFWMHISKEKQLRRIRAREKSDLKQWKLTDEDWRIIEKRREYTIPVDVDAGKDVMGRRGVECRTR